MGPAKLVGTSLSQGQVDGVGRIVSEARQLAYRETVQTTQPIRERGGEKYLRPKPCYPWGGRGAPAR